MSEQKPTLPTFTAKPAPEPSETKQRLREVSKAAAERARKEVTEKTASVVDKASVSTEQLEQKSELTLPLQSEPPKRKVIRPKKARPDSKVVSEENSKLEEKLGIGKRKRFEEANTRVTTYIDNDQLEQLRNIKKEYNVPMTEVIHKALAAYLV